MQLDGRSWPHLDGREELLESSPNDPNRTVANSLGSTLIRFSTFIFAVFLWSFALAEETAGIVFVDKSDEKPNLLNNGESGAAASLRGLDAEADAGNEEVGLNRGKSGNLEAPGAIKTGEKKKRSLGIKLSSPSGRFFVNPWLRLQTRYSDPFDSDPRTPDVFDNPAGADFELRRARLKIDAELGSPDLTLYFEHELTSDRPLLDLRVDAKLPYGWRTRIGQYKILYNRERVDSSGKQTFVERSIATYAFTLDRQRGITVAKQWGKDSRANQWLFAGAFAGDGREPGARGEGHLYMLRWQWNFLGPDLPFSQSDIKFREQPAASFALAGAAVESPYTRFSSSGGGQLDGFGAGGDDRYRMRQWLQEFALHYKGIAIQQEYHAKHIRDRDLGTTSTLRGGYAQVSKAWRARWLGPYPAEIGVRHAVVDWQDTPADRRERELTVVANLFFDGHNNKVTAEISRLSLDYDGAADRADKRWRVQWDVSF
jgi:phosphate-selective porin OprO/OprP